MQQDGIDGSGQGSGQNPDFEDDDEDLGNNGSGSGHHPITEIGKHNKTTSPQPKYLQFTIIIFRGKRGESNPGHGRPEGCDRLFGRGQIVDCGFAVCARSLRDPKLNNHPRDLYKKFQTLTVRESKKREENCFLCLLRELQKLDGDEIRSKQYGYIIATHIYTTTLLLGGVFALFSNRFQYWLFI